MVSFFFGFCLFGDDEDLVIRLRFLEEKIEGDSLVG